MRKPLFLTIGCVMGLWMWGQNLPSTFNDILPPNAGNLGLYNLYPVSKFTGMPDISIPLYTLKEKDITVPITLRYNIHAIKPEIHPSWVGHGWSLFTGGMITRKVKGGVDEYEDEDFKDPALFSYYSHYSALDRYDWNQLAVVGQFYRETFPINPKLQAIPAPDEFTFTVGGYTGRFYYNHEGKWVVKSKTPGIKVKEIIKRDFMLPMPWSSSHTLYTEQIRLKRIFYGFELTLPEGTKYIFGNTPSSIEFTNKYLNTIWSYHKDDTANVWHLTKIISPSKQTIDFSYDRGVIVMQQINYEEFSAFWERTRRSKIEQHGFFFKGLPILFYPVYLKEIKCSKAKIVFERSLSKQLDYHMRWAYDLERGYDDLYSHYAFDQFHWYKLDGFTVYDPKDKAVKKINFSYQDQKDKRLFLQAVSIGDKKYQLKYNTLELPGYNGRELDHWGYYNGRDFFQSYSFTDARGRLKSLEAIKNDLKNNYPSSRVPDAYYAQAGILTRMIYPTGGFINFTYELNDHVYIVDKYPSVNNGNPYFSLRYKIGKGGGLRIKQMTAYEKDGKKSLDKEFIYRRDYLSGGTRSSGTLAGESIYFEQGNASHGDFWVWTNSAREILNTTSGNMVTYSEVVEKDRLNGGGIVYKYTNHDQLAYRDHLAEGYISFNHLPYRYAAYNKNVERGNLLEKIVFDKDRKVVRKEKYTYKKPDTWQSSTVRAYDRQNQQYLSLRRLQVGGSEVIIPPSFNQRVSAYKIFTYTPLLSSKEITEYFHGRALTTEHHYFYNYDPPTLKKQTTTNSKNQTIETEYQYAHDMYDEKRLIDENRIAVPLITTVRKGGKTLSQQRTKYGSFGSLYLPQFVLAKKGSVALSENRDKKITYDRYDAKGNLLQYHTENGLTTSILWDRTGEYPIAKVEGAAYSQISRYQSHAEDLRTALPKARVTTYTYQPLVGITSITQPNGQKELYEYDEFNRLKTVKDHQGKILRQYEYHYRNSK